MTAIQKRHTHAVRGHDFYPTAPEAVEALLDIETSHTQFGSPPAVTVPSSFRSGLRAASFMPAILLIAGALTRQAQSIF